MGEQPIIDLMLVTQLFSTLFMTGLIWFVQIIHYPLFTHVDRDSFPDYEQYHRVRTAVVVGPVMLLEVISAVACVYWSTTPMGLADWTGIGLLLVIWVSTIGLQVPAHDQLARQYSETQWKRLVSTNWIRTAAWSARSGILLWQLLLRLTTTMT